MRHLFKETVFVCFMMCIYTEVHGKFKFPCDCHR